MQIVATHGGLSMLVSRIVGVLCCLALCGCIFQPIMYVPEIPPAVVERAKDYRVIWPNVSWDTSPVGVHFIFPKKHHDFASAVYGRLGQRQFLKHTENTGKDIYVVTVYEFNIEKRPVQSETEHLYYQGTSESLLMQFERHHISYHIYMSAQFTVSKNNKMIAEYLFEGRVPDGYIFCNNFDEYNRLPKWGEPIYDWRTMKHLCTAIDSPTNPQIIVQKLAEIFAGDMEELIIGLMKP